MKKATIQLTASFIVMLILAIAIFTFGITLSYKFMSGAKEMSTRLDKKTISQIEELLDTGAKVSIPFNRKEIKRGKNAVFGLGILNVDPDKEEFFIDVVPGNAFDKNKNKITPNKIKTENSFLWKKTHKIENNKKKTIGIAVAVPSGTTSGIYILNVYVCSSDTTISSCPASNYGTPQKIYVEVP